MDFCLFCKIANFEIDSNIIYSDDVVTCFLDISPATYGHTILTTKKHFKNFTELDDKTIAHVFKVAREVTKFLTKKLCADGFNILSNINEVGGQTIMHFHLHLIPRYKADHDDLFKYTPITISSDELKFLKDSLTSNLKK